MSGCQTNPKPRHGTCGLDFLQLSGSQVAIGGGVTVVGLGRGRRVRGQHTAGLAFDAYERGPMTRGQRPARSTDHAGNAATDI